VRAVVLLTVAFAAGCGASQAAKDKVRSRLHVDADHAAAALALEEEADTYGEKDRLLYLMDLCVVRHYAHKYADSNRVCQEAAVLGQELWTKSISEEVSSYLLNDNTITYSGEDYERVLLHLVGMLNYAALGETSGALVEARQLDNKLELLQENYEDPSPYREDAFGRYLSGLLYEANGDLNDAFIDLKKALSAYQGSYAESFATPLPPEVAQDAMRTARSHGMAQEVEELERRYGSGESGSPLSRKTGELLLVVHAGYAPYKVTDFWEIPVIGNIAYPMARKRSSLIHNVRVKSMATGQVATSRLVEDISAIASADMEARTERAKSKAVARAAAKGAAAAAVGLALGALSGNFAGLVAGSVMHGALMSTEAADVRSWSTLPSEIVLVRISLPPGYHELAIKYYGHYGHELFRTLLKGVKIRAGQRSVIVQKVP